MILPFARRRRKRSQELSYSSTAATVGKWTS
jgi:hypothetical protein